MIEVRWLEYEEEEYLVPPAPYIQYGNPFDKVMATKHKLQYRFYSDIGGPYPNYQWSEWTDVPVVKDEQNAKT